MAHLIFIALHFIAVLFTGTILLFITIPAHLIYTAVRSNKQRGSQPSPHTHIKCPDCRQLVEKDARVCAHCGCRLVPQ